MKIPHLFVFFNYSLIPLTPFILKGEPRNSLFARRIVNVSHPLFKVKRGSGRD